MSKIGKRDKSSYYNPLSYKVEDIELNIYYQHILL